MSDEEIVSVLADIMEYDFHKDDGFSVNPVRCLESRDALDPVLAKLSDGQWHQFLVALAGYWNTNTSGEVPFTHWLLACPTRVLAEAVAMVVKEGK